MYVPHTCEHCSQTYTTNWNLGQNAGCRCAKAKLVEAVRAYRRSGYVVARDYVAKLATALGLSVQQALDLAS